jgi:hypothetical protein
MRSLLAPSQSFFLPARNPALLPVENIFELILIHYLSFIYSYRDNDQKQSKQTGISRCVVKEERSSGH